MYILIKTLGVFLLLSGVCALPPQSFSPSAGQQVSFSHSLTINASYPNLNFSTFMGGNQNEWGYRLVVGSDGSCYITGTTYSSNFPTLNAFNGTNSGNFDAIVAKFYSNGSLLWSTYLGGEGWDEGYGIAVATDGSCYVVGRSDSENFPIKNAFCDTYKGNTDSFITKFASNGSLLWSSFFGGSQFDSGSAIALANNGDIYITGQTLSNDFPFLNAYDDSYNGQTDAYIAKFNASGSLLWSTYFGGGEFDWGSGIAVADDNSCYITGTTRSSDLPILNAYNSTYGGSSYDTFVTKFDANGTLLWSTFHGGADEDFAKDIAVSIDNNCYIIGQTKSTNFPTLNGFKDTYSGERDAFISKFDAYGDLQWCTYHGGELLDEGNGIAVADDGSCYAIGTTWSNDFPIRYAYDSTFKGCDAYITKFASAGELLWSTFLGGSTIETGNGIAVLSGTGCYMIGETFSADFPMKNAYNSTYNDQYDIFVTKFDEIIDLTEPIISNINHSPVNPTTRDAITFSCTVTDENNIQSVTLWFRVNNASWQINPMNMKPLNVYERSLTLNLVKEGRIDYYIEAVDNSPSHNIAIENNNGLYYQIIILAASSYWAYSFLALLVVIPAIVLVIWKVKRK